MALVLADRVLETSSSTGTGNFSLAGAATGYQSFSNGVGNGNTTYYTIECPSTGEWEVGLGTFTAPSTLARTTVYSSSNSGSAVNFSAGSKNVFVGISATKWPAGVLGVANGGTGVTSSTGSGSVVLSASPTLTNSQTITSAGDYSSLQLNATATGGRSYWLVSTSNTAGIGGGKWGLFDNNAGVYRLTVDGSGTFTVAQATTLSGALTYGGVTLSNSVTGTGSMVLGTSPQFTTGIGVGRAATSSALIATGGNIGGTASMYNTLVQGTIQSDVTGAYYGVWSQPSTAAASFTLNALVHYGAQFTAAGAGSTVANQYGFYVGSGTLTGATANYAFYGGLASGSGAYNLYMGGTAANYLGGATTFNAAITYGGVTLSNSVTGTGSMVLSASPTFTGIVNTATLQSTVADNAVAARFISPTARVRIFPYLTNGSQIDAVNPAEGAYAQLLVAGNPLYLNANGTNVVTVEASLVTLNQALKYGGVTLSNSVTGTGSMVLSDSPTITSKATINGVQFGSITANASVGLSGNELVLRPKSTGSIYLQSDAGTTWADINGTRLSLAVPLSYGGVTLTNAVTGTGKMVLDTSPTINGPTISGVLTGIGSNSVLTYLSSGVSMPSQNTWYTGPNTGTIGSAGQTQTWLVVASGSVTAGGQAYGEIQLYDGTTQYSAQGMVFTFSDWYANGTAAAVVTFTGTKTFYLRASCNIANATLRATSGYGVSGTTYIYAVRLA